MATLPAPICIMITYANLLNLTGMIPFKFNESLFDHSFLKMAMKSDNVVVRTIINMDIEGFHSVMGRNVRLMQSKFKMDESNVLIFWNHQCHDESAVRLSVQVGGGQMSVTVHFLTR